MNYKVYRDHDHKKKVENSTLFLTCFCLKKSPRALFWFNLNPTFTAIPICIAYFESHFSYLNILRFKKLIYCHLFKT